jgi:UDP-N-acetylmuramate--alanine ligase
LADGEHRALSGRRFYFVGIGGSGLSAYANIARALGAQVRGWDLRETIFMETLAGVAIDIGAEPTPPKGWEVVVSTAHLGRVEGVSRAEFLAEIVAARRSVVVGGAHGKTTTAAMIAFALLDSGRDPAWVIGGVVPQLGGNAGDGSGWLIVEGDESDRSIGLLEPAIAVVTNIELDHHSAYGSEAELRHFFDAWLAHVPEVVRGWELEPAEFELSVPGEHNRRNAAAAMAVLRLIGVPDDEAKAALGRFQGVDRRLQLVGEAAGIRVLDDYGHNPTEIDVTLRAARAQTTGRLIAVYQPHVFERTRHLHRELGAALALADAAIVTDVLGARDTPRENVTGKLIVDAVPWGTRVGWAPSADDAVHMALAWLRSGDTLVTFGVGEPWKIARAVVGALDPPANAVPVG